MSKIGVGVGDDFPVDDSKGRNTGEQSPGDDRAEFEEWKRRRDAYRAEREARRAQRDAWRSQRDEWRRRRDEWRAQWRAQRNMWRDEVRDYPRGGYDRGYPGYARHFPFFFGYGIWRLFAIVLTIAAVIFMISHIGYVLVGLVALAVLFCAYHRFGHDPLDFSYAGRGDYPDAPPAPPAQQTPPPAPQAPPAA